MRAADADRGQIDETGLLSTQILAVPEDDPLAGAIETPDATRPVVILSLRTDDGIEGIGVTFYGGALTTDAEKRGRSALRD